MFCSFVLTSNRAWCLAWVCDEFCHRIAQGAHTRVGCVRAGHPQGEDPERQGQWGHCAGHLRVRAGVVAR